MERLNELFPKKVKFNLENVKEDLYFAPITLNKYIEVSNRIGNIDDLLATGELENICRIAFNFLDSETAIMFGGQEINYINDETGKLETEHLAGFRLLMRLIKNEEEVFLITKSILKAIGYSDKDIKKIFDETKNKVKQEESKKKAQIGE